MARLKTKCGTSFVVDAEFKKKHADKTWYITNTGYAAFGVSGGCVLAHRLVVGHIPKGKVVDHINGDKLDNRVVNLRVVEQSQNVIRSGHKRNTYRGVGWSKQKKLWRARIVYMYHDIHIGFFKAAEDAARAYDKKALELFGEFAYLNFKE